MIGGVLERPCSTPADGSLQCARPWRVTPPLAMLVLSLVATACINPRGRMDSAGSTSDAVPAASLGQVTTGIHRSGTGSRPWRLFTPARPASPRSMLVLLHGCLQSASDIAAGSRIDSVAGAQGYYVLYPEQDSTANVRRCWNWFEPAHQRRGQGEPAIIASMVEEAVRANGIDRARVHLAGISAGAGMSILAAVGYPEQFATVSLIAGVPWRAAQNVAQALAVMKDGTISNVAPPSTVVEAMDAMGAPARAVPTLVVHGGKDVVLNPGNGDAAAAQMVGVHSMLRQRAGRAPLMEVIREPRVQNGYSVNERAWRDDRGAELVKYLRVAELGHAWSGGSAAGSFTDVQGPDASRLILSFMMAHPTGAR